MAYIIFQASSRINILKALHGMLMAYITDIDSFSITDIDSVLLLACHHKMTRK